MTKRKSSGWQLLRSYVRLTPTYFRTSRTTSSSRVSAARSSLMLKRSSSKIYMLAEPSRKIGPKKKRKKRGLSIRNAHS